MRDHLFSNDAASAFIDHYGKSLNILLSHIQATTLNAIALSLLTAWKNNAPIYLIGNGGSASIASHFANDLAIGLSTQTKIKLNAYSLVDNQSIITAIANDYGYEHIFSRQLMDNFDENSILIAISASGNSANIIRAVKQAKASNGLVIALVGFDGGELLPLSDIAVHFSTEPGAYGLVEDGFAIVNHLLVSYIKESVENELERM